jgi:predicted dehydrogenase
MRKQRWGILGVAHINQRLLPAFRRSAHADLIAIASRSKEKAEAAARADGIARAYGSYEELLADPDIDIVYNPLPNTLHAEWTRRAADRGKHILCEKPLTPTAAEAAELVAYCARRRVQLLDGFMWPHHPRTQRIRSFIDQGGIGAVRHVQGAFTFPLPMDPGNIRLRPELAGGSLLDVGCYPIYGIRWAFGGDLPVMVFATASYQHGVDVEMSGLLTFANGRTAGFDCGFTRPLRGWLEITGTEGVIDIPEMWLPAPQARWTVCRDGKAVEESIDGEDQILHMIDNLSRAVEENRPIKPEPLEAVRTLRVLDALARSARTGQPVCVASAE